MRYAKVNVYHIWPNVTCWLSLVFCKHTLIVYVIVDNLVSYLILRCFGFSANHFGLDKRQRLECWHTVIWRLALQIEFIATPRWCSNHVSTCLHCRDAWLAVPCEPQRLKHLNGLNFMQESLTWRPNGSKNKRNLRPWKWMEALFLATFLTSSTRFESISF